MASGPITSWQMGRKWKQRQTLFCWAPRSLWMGTAAMKLKDTCSLEGKLWQNLDSILESRDITLPTKVHLVKAMLLVVVMYGCESWTIKKAEHWRIHAFKLWCWRRLLRVPWTARSNQSTLKEINIEYLLEGLMLERQYFGHLCKKPSHWKRPWCWERLKAKGEGGKGWDGRMASLTQWTWVWANPGRWWRIGKTGVLRSIELQRVRHSLAAEQQQWLHRGQEIVNWEQGVKYTLGWRWHISKTKSNLFLTRILILLSFPLYYLRNLKSVPILKK